MSTSHDQSNSASRLLSILSSAVKLGKGGEPICEAWAKVFEIQNDDRKLRNVYTKLAHLGTLVDDLVEEVSENIPKDRQPLYLRHIADIRKGITPVHLQQAWEDSKQFFNATVLTSLEFCADALPKEPIVTPDELTQIQTSLSELITEIESSDIDSQLKKWLLTLVAEARYSIDLYRIQGVRAFRRALRDCYGNLILFQQAFPTLAISAKKGTQLGDRLMAFLVGLNAIAAKAKEFQPLLETGKTVFGFLIDCAT